MLLGAPTRTRTANLLITNQLLYQLSYEGAKSFLVENIKLSKPNKDNILFFNFYNIFHYSLNSSESCWKWPVVTNPSYVSLYEIFLLVLW